MIRKEFHTHHQTIPHPLKKRRRTVAAPPNTRVSCKPHIFIPPPAIPYTRTITLEPSFQHHLVAALHPTISLHAASFNANVITTPPPPHYKTSRGYLNIILPLPVVTAFKGFITFHHISHFKCQQTFIFTLQMKKNIQLESVMQFMREKQFVHLVRDQRELLEVTCFQTLNPILARGTGQLFAKASQR